MKKLGALILLLFLSIQLVSAARIQGTTYDISLNELKDVILIINTKPEQTIILKEPNYSLELVKGSYKIKAFYYENGLLEAYTEEEISVGDEGNYTLDLILFPSFEEEDILFNESNFEFQDDLEIGSNTPVILIVLGVAIVIFILFRYKKKVNKEELQNELENKFDDIYLNNVLEFIRKNQGRTTQKDIRKQLKISEAKVSLVLSQLESEGKIKKIKKGRGNIIILNK
ncbi:MAG TPA: winged helix-turn-helix transcriptional regulator [Candidatus Nanoarchaeia archaeon]|nr:winged helix-turn-helix transcriptional regulator [Candidatus Nanoarchaeia archaeon]